MSALQPLSTVNRELKKYKNLPGPGILMGVCSGIAYRFGWPTWIVRLGFILAFACFGVGLVAYLLVGFLAPDATAPKDYGNRTGDE